MLLSVGVGSLYDDLFGPQMMPPTQWVTESV